MGPPFYPVASPLLCPIHESQSPVLAFWRDGLMYGGSCARNSRGFRRLPAHPLLLSSMSYHCDHQLHHHHHHNHYHHHHHYDQDNLSYPAHDPHRNVAGPKICECGRTLKTNYDREVDPALRNNIAPTFKTVFKLFSLQRHHLKLIDNWKTRILCVCG